MGQAPPSPRKSTQPIIFNTLFASTPSQLAIMDRIQRYINPSTSLYRCHVGPDQPTRILRRGDHDVTSDVSVVGNLELPNPTTPPRPRSMYDGISNGQYQGNQSAPDMNQRRKKSRKSQGGGITRASGVRSSDLNQAPIPASPQQPLTPSRPNETPVKAYAGPTFHASPAASSLPIPKFFSRSVPNVDKSRMEQETVDTTSESDNSPFLQNSHPTHDLRAREDSQDSPLDIFFQADRNAKTKAQVRSPAGSNSLRSESQNDVRHHSRQPTDSSLGGMFPLEMDGAASETSDSTNNNEQITPAPKAMSEADYRDDQRKAQTLELKKLLFPPKPQRPAPSTPRSVLLHPELLLAGDSPGLVPDATSRDQQRHAALLALAQKQILGKGNNNVSAAQRPPSSKLWKEISVPSSPGVSELPTTPTQTRVQKTSTNINGHAQQQQNDSASPYSPFPSAFTPPAKSPGGFQSTPSRHSKDAKSIEEDLRRILKLDVLGGDSVTGVQS
ncbi:hypothetical protein HO173_000191 [Letharia columbiana]|uniref:Uncharacterized protein n=1 Tax=Letharia columbiana TaxID=112416 RepID=A0A8H6LA45_9LECA|nr:uncharacterized protein HO173_000191 [Letharia columbiana]KAF6241481.1 hypothetical protein HO173_000191 [Letharia columbiana]